MSVSAKSKLFRRFHVVEDKAENGAWVDLGEGIRFKLRRIKSKASQQVRERLNEPHIETIRAGKLSEDVAKDLLVEQLARGVIADWEGVQDPETGELVPYSAETAVAFLKALPDLAEEIFQHAISRDVFQEKMQDDAVKN